MNVLGIDTSNLVLSIALVDDERLRGEYTTNMKKNHSIRLMPALDRLMADLEMVPDELNGIAVAEGPGSYTGVRIGVTAAKSLAWALGVPLIGVSSLKAMAMNGLFFDGWVSPLIDARRGQVYTGLYQPAAHQDMDLVEQDRIILLEHWLDHLAEGDRPVLFVGDDVNIHRIQIEKRLGEQACFLSAEGNIPRAAHIARLGLRGLQQGQQQLREQTREQTQLHTFAPAYLQLAEAEAKWLSRQKEQQQTEGTVK